MAEDIRPATEQELLERINTGRRFEELAQDPLIVRWMNDTDEIMMRCLRDADVRDTEEILHWKQMLECKALLMKCLQTYINTGKVTQDQLEKQRNLKQKISRFKFR